jgi:hypothetical protein
MDVKVRFEKIAHINLFVDTYKIMGWANYAFNEKANLWVIQNHSEGFCSISNIPGCLTEQEMLFLVLKQ